tara:strand:+ start:1317 stop:1646 length:330 start_codon:yes stop_codon:yes gene_type:complete
MSLRDLKKRGKEIRILTSDQGVRYLKHIKYPTNIPYSNTDVYLLTSFGDRLDTLAKKFYDDTRLWWVIAVGNPDIIRKDSISLKAGLRIRIPRNLQYARQAFKAMNNFN